jgi:hypothetical protein
LEEDQDETTSDTESLIDKSDGINIKSFIIRFLYLLLAIFRNIKNFLYRIEELIYFITDAHTDFKINLQTDIEYYSGTDKHHHKHKLNIYLPVPVDNTKVINKFPIVIHVHGGGWARGDR